MLSRTQSTICKKWARQAAKFSSAGPYNPYRYKTHFVPRDYPENQEIFDKLAELYSSPPAPIRNMRHVNPVRESGPLPPYEGPYTMEDIRKLFNNTTIGYDFNHCSTDVDEIMRRVPGITRKEVEFITQLGLSPDEEVDFAYIAYNIGLDVFYLANQMYVARQVVTNSKGEKVEVYWNHQAFEDLSMLNVGFAPVLEHVDYHWEIFLWGDPPIHPLCDFDLSVPGSWFEYECEWWGEMNMIEDQQTLPEDLREQRVPRHPNARKELWQSQEKLQQLEDMADPEWVPQGTTYNIYNQANFNSAPPQKEENAPYFG